MLPCRLRIPLISLALVLSACTSRDQAAANAAAEAEAAFGQGRIPAAIRSIKAALAVRDDVSDYWLLLARIDTAAKDLPGAFDAYEHVIALDRGNVEALRLLCQLGVTVNVPDKVDKYADKLLLLTPTDPLPLVAKGGAALQRGDTKGALQFAEQVLAANPQDNDALILKGRTLAARGDVVGAANLIEGAQVGGDDDSAKLKFLKDLYVRAADRAKYQATLKRLATVAPDDADIQLEYADMLFQIGQSSVANAVIFQQMQRHPNDVGIATGILDVWLKQGPEALAPDQLEGRASAVSLEMKSVFARFANEIGRPDLAIAILPRTFDDASPGPALSDAKAALAFAAGLQGRSAYAMGILDEILSTDEGHPAALLARARLKAAGKDLTGAISDARQLVAEDPRNVAARLSLVDFLTMRKDGDLALSALREAVRTIPEDPRLAARLAKLFIGRGDRAAAADILRDLLRAAPVSLRALRLRAALDPTGPPMRAG